MDTTRLLAKKKIRGKLVQTTVLLLAGQEQIHEGSSSNRNGNGKRDGFDIIMTRIVKHSVALRWEIGENGKARKQLEEKRTLIDCAVLLVDIISQARDDLDAYIQTHSEVPHFLYIAVTVQSLPFTTYLYISILL